MKRILLLCGSLSLLAFPQAAFANSANPSESTGSGISLNGSQQVKGETSSVLPAPIAIAPASSAGVTPEVPVRLPLLAQNIPALKSTTSVDQLSADPLQSNLPQVSPQTSPARSMAQVTSVSQLSDVKPTDWAFQALQSLVEKYGCIAGYPDGTFRGNRSATRYELAAALNACLDVISDRFATKEDLLALRQLMVEFAAELATIKGRVNSLEARTAALEAIQFSTTTKLAGEAIFQATQYAGGDKPVPAGFAQGRGGPIGDKFFISGRATLNLLTSFSGKDLLITSIQAGNYPTDLAAGFPGTLAPQVTQTSENNQFDLYLLQYRFPVFNDKVTIIATAAGGELADFVDTLNPYLDSDGQGSISAFGLRNPIYRQITRFAGTEFSGAGIGLTTNFSEKFSVGVGYLAPLYSAANPQAQTGFGVNGGGLFGGDYAAIAQLTFKPIKTLGFGLTYVRSYTSVPLGGIAFGGFTGSTRAQTAFPSFNVATPTSADSAGFEFSWTATPKFVLSGWVGASFATAQNGGGRLRDNQGILQQINAGDSSTILNYALTFAFPDLFKQGSLGGIVLGSQPQVIYSSVTNNTDPDTNVHAEVFYRYQVNDNISITPGVFAVFNPEGNSANPTVVVGTIRTTFTF
jgi:hypothetical protein